MTWEVLNTSLKNTCRHHISINSDPYARYIGGWPPGITLLSSPSTFGGYLQVDNLGNQNIFHVFAGTQDLYYVAMEHNYTASSVFSKLSSTPLSDYSSGTINGSTTLVVYKNHVEHERIPFASIVSSCSERRIPAPPPVNLEIQPINNSAHLLNRWIYQYHPETDALNYMEVETTMGADIIQKVTHQVQGETTLADATHMPLFFGAGYPIYQVAFWVEPRTMYDRTFESEFGFGVNGLLDPRLASFRDSDFSRSGHTETILESRSYAPWTTGMNSASWEQHPTSASQAKWGSDTFTDIRYDRFPLTSYGSTANFYLLNNADHDLDAKFGALRYTFATHRPVVGSQIPYLWLRRKHNLRANFRDTMFAHSVVMGDFAMSDDDPTLGTPNPYHFFDGDFERRLWWLWAKPPGHLADPTNDPEGVEPHWNDEDWELVSNFISLGELNAMTNRIGKNLFDIGIM
jgi:hypothetical protein